jgi:hypothetical protein
MLFLVIAYKLQPRANVANLLRDNNELKSGFASFDVPTSFLSNIEAIEMI